MKAVHSVSRYWKKKVLDKSVEPKGNRLRGHNLQELYLCTVKRKQSAANLVCCLLALSQKHSTVCLTLANDQSSMATQRQEWMVYLNIPMKFHQSVDRACVSLHSKLSSCASCTKLYQYIACASLSSTLSSCASAESALQPKIGKPKALALTKKSELGLILNTVVTSLYSVCKVAEPSIQM